MQKAARKDAKESQRPKERLIPDFA